MSVNQGKEHTMSNTDDTADYVHEACGTDEDITTCGQCLGVWCDRCDPAHGPLCPWCHGMGYSTAAVLAPVHRQANHERNNGGYPVQVERWGES